EIRVSLPCRASFSRSIRRGRGTTLGRGGGIKSFVANIGVDMDHYLDCSWAPINSCGTILGTAAKSLQRSNPWTPPGIFATCCLYAQGDAQVVSSTPESITSQVRVIHRSSFCRRIQPLYLCPCCTSGREARSCSARRRQRLRRRAAGLRRRDPRPRLHQPGGLSTLAHVFPPVSHAVIHVRPGCTQRTLLLAGAAQ